MLLSITGLRTTVVGWTRIVPVLAESSRSEPHLRDRQARVNLFQKGQFKVLQGFQSSRPDMGSSAGLIRTASSPPIGCNWFN